MNAGRAHEPMGINVGRVGWLAGIAFATFLLALGASLLIWHLWVRSPSRLAARSPAATATRPPPQAPIALDALRAQQRELLHGYGWVDRQAGIACIPVERAMALLAAGRASVRDDPGMLESENSAPDGTADQAKQEDAVPEPTP